LRERLFPPAFSHQRFAVPETLWKNTAEFRDSAKSVPDGCGNINHYHRVTRWG
jgi:hypothetical protein